ncbi:MAG: hypothetical protein HY565_06140 [Candidatus Kerfeldbacteria bacterium]|nr:hypothetical protein [Candidatus Kerfeldbacteria bacterium]
MPVKRHLVERIDQALCAWEDGLFVQEMAAIAGCQGRADRSVNPLVWNWPQFRRFLIEAQANLFDDARFGIDVSADGSDHTGFYNNFLLEECEMDALAFLAWMTESRRVYSLDNELTHLLVNTSLSRTRWADINLPFNAFALTPDEPIVVGQTGIDCIIVRKVVKPGEAAKPEDQIHITCFRSSLKNWPRLTSDFKDKLRKMVRRRDWSGMAVNITKRQQQLRGLNCDTIHLFVRDPTHLINESAEDIMSGVKLPPGVDPVVQHRALDQIYRLVGSFCLYLKNLPAGSPHTSSESIQRSKGDDPKAIIWESEVTTVTNCYPLTPEEQDWLGTATARERYELCAHWRSGYWHRPMGMGQVPGAERTEWTRPTLVRKDRLPEGAKPGGTMQKLRSGK